MAGAFLLFSPSISLPFPLFSHSSPSPTPPTLPFLSHGGILHRRRPLAIAAAAGGANRRSRSDPRPSDEDPPEAPEDSSHGVPRINQFERQVARARRIQDEQYEKDKHLFLQALDPVDEDDGGGVSRDPSGTSASGEDDLFGDIDRAIALKRQEFVSQGLLPPKPSKKASPAASRAAEADNSVKDIDELTPEEVVDLDEIQELQGLTVLSEDEDGEDDVDGDSLVDPSDEDESSVPGTGASSSFDLDVDEFGRSPVRILEPKFKMTLAELLDESRLVPVSVYGDLEVSITGIQHDPREVSAGDLFVCCSGLNGGDGHDFLTEADKRGAVALVADKEINIDETLGCKALVIVEGIQSVLSVLTAAFYRHPSKSLSVIGVTGTNGKTTVTHLVKAMYEAMGLRTGMLSKLGCYIHGDNRLDAPQIVDTVTAHKLMAKMVHNGTEAAVVEASADGLAHGRCDEIDFDIAVFTNFRDDHPEFSGTEEEYMASQGKLFAMMVDPEQHRKVVNIDDPHAPYFIAQGSPDVPVVTYSLENKNSDVHALKFELSLFETQVLVQTPQGILEISSGLLGKNNIYNILAAVSVGIAVGAPLEDIVRGIEEVDAVPGRCELIDEEQAFGVIVDHAKTPEALSRLLDAARELGPRRIITVVGCEGERDRGKRPLMTKIATDKSDVIMLTSDNPRNEDPLDILDDMLVGVGWTMQDYLKHGENDYYPPLPNGHRLFLHDIRRVAVRAAVAMGEEGDIVVVTGKGHETHQIEGDKKEFFDDREECREALQYVDELHQAGIDTSEFPWRLPESH